MNFNDPAEPDQSTPFDDDDHSQEATMPLGVGDLNDDAGLDVLASTGRRRKRMSAGSLVLILVVVCAVGGLFSMRFLARATAALNNETEFEKVIDEFFGDGKNGDEPEKGELTGPGGKGVLEVLNETYTEHQVPLANVIKNPFIVFQPEVIPVGPSTDDPDRLVAEQQRKWRQQREEYQLRVEAAAATLSVKSILLGSKPLANMGGRIVHVGDSFVVGSEQFVFEVTAINSDSVQLITVSKDFDLTCQHTVRIDRNR